MDSVITSYETDKDKGAQLFIMLPYPMGLVRAKKDITYTAMILEENGLIPVFVTFQSTPGGSDFDELGQERFWPPNRTPLSNVSGCVGGQNPEEFCSAEGETDEENPASDPE